MSRPGATFFAPICRANEVISGNPPWLVTEAMGMVHISYGPSKEANRMGEWTVSAKPTAARMARTVSQY